MRSYVAVMLAALVVSVLLTPLARRFALAVGAVSRTGGRHVHGQLTPRLGGVAIAAGWLLSVLGAWRFGVLPPHVIAQYRSEFVAVLVGSTAMCLVGAADDIRSLPVSRKLMAQVAVAILAYGCGFRIDSVALPFVGTLSMGIFALPVTILWIVGITNAVNLIDGLDGLAAGVAFFAAFTTFTVAWIGGSPFAAWMTAPLMGVLAGFLFFNFNPARIFMGDSGSYFLGYVLATISLTGARQQKASTAISLLVPMIALGLPIFDTLFTMFRRYLERRSMFSPDRGHIHHRLLDLGLTHRRTVVLLYGVCVIFTACAIGVSFGRLWQAGVALLSVSLVCVALVRFAGYFEYLHRVRRQEARIYDPSTDRLRHVVPLLLRELSSAHGEREIMAVLPSCLAGCAMERIDIETVEGESLHSIEAGPETGTGREILRARFPIGREDRARARISFAWQEGGPDVSPSTAILLQLLVDALAHRLQLSGSELGPSHIDDEAESLPHGLVPLPSSGEGA